MAGAAEGLFEIEAEGLAEILPATGNGSPVLAWPSSLGGCACGLVPVACGTERTQLS